MNIDKTRAVFRLLCFWLAVVVIGSSTHSQESGAKASIGSREHCGIVFEDVRAGISTGNAGLLSRHFASQVAINLTGAENSTFSADQSHYVLENFLKSRKFAEFQFSVLEESDAVPNARGEVEFMYKGSREVAHVYVTLSADEKDCKITQLTIY